MYRSLREADAEYEKADGESGRRRFCSGRERRGKRRRRRIRQSIEDLARSSTSEGTNRNVRGTFSFFLSLSLYIYFSRKAIVLSRVVRFGYVRTFSLPISPLASLSLLQKNTRKRLEIARGSLEDTRKNMSTLCREVQKRRKERAKETGKAKTSATSDAEGTEGIGEVFEQRDKSLALLEAGCRDARMETLVDRALCGKCVRTPAFYGEKKAPSQEGKDEGEDVDASFADLEESTARHSNSLNKLLSAEKRKYIQHISDCRTKLSQVRGETKDVDREIAALEKKLLQLKGRKIELGEQSRATEERLKREERRLRLNEETFKGARMWQKEEIGMLEDLKKGDSFVRQVASKMLEKCRAEARVLLETSLSSSNHAKIKKKKNVKKAKKTGGDADKTENASAQTFVHRAVAEAVMFVGLQEQCHKFLADRLTGYCNRRRDLDEEVKMLSSLGMTLGTNLVDLQRKVTALKDRETEDRNVLLTLAKQTVQIRDRLDRLRRLIEESSREDSEYEKALGTARNQVARILMRLEPLLFRNGQSDVDVMVESGGWDTYAERVKKTLAADAFDLKPRPATTASFRPVHEAIVSASHASPRSNIPKRSERTSTTQNNRRPHGKAIVSSSSSTVREASKRSQARRSGKTPTSSSRKKGESGKRTASKSKRSAATPSRKERAPAAAKKSEGKKGKASSKSKAPVATPSKRERPATNKDDSGKGHASSKTRKTIAAASPPKNQNTRSKRKGGGKTVNSGVSKAQSTPTKMSRSKKSTPTMSQTKTSGGNRSGGSQKKKGKPVSMNSHGSRPSTKRSSK